MTKNASDLPTATPFPKSLALHRRAERLIPGAHHLSGRPLVDPLLSPMYFERGKGARVWDVDGHEYIDFLMAFGAFGLGYANEEVDRAAFEQASRGSLLSLNHPLHLRFLEELLARFPGSEMGAFFKTGSEATTAALRIARRATGRRRVARAGYHGWHDWCLPHNEEVPAGLAAQVLEFNANAPPSLQALFDAYPGEVAAVILAPEMVLPFSGETIVALQDVSRRNGAVFILDEVKTAFRIAPGSVQRRVGIQPDLTTVSKALGNGWPVAAVLGKRNVMESAAGMHLSATYHGETASMAAALATMAIIDRDGVLAHLWEMGERFLDGLTALVRAHRVPAEAYGEPLPPMPFLRFTHPDASLNALVQSTFYQEVHARGVLLHPRHLWFISHSHRPSDIDRALDACDDAFAAARRREPRAFDHP